MIVFLNIILITPFLIMLILFFYILKQYYRMRNMRMELEKEKMSLSEATNLYFAGKISVEEYEKYLDQGGSV